MHFPKELQSLHQVPKAPGVRSHAPVPTQHPHLPSLGTGKQRQPLAPPCPCPFRPQGICLHWASGWLREMLQTIQSAPATCSNDSRLDWLSHGPHSHSHLPLEISSDLILISNFFNIHSSHHAMDQGNGSGTHSSFQFCSVGHPMTPTLDHTFHTIPT